VLSAVETKILTEAIRPRGGVDDLYLHLAKLMKGMEAHKELRPMKLLVRLMLCHCGQTLGVGPSL
jgi:hypothetical protein